MIKPDMIPDEVVRALKQCLNGCDCDECLAVCVAASLNAWPKTDQYLGAVVLTLPQKEKGGQ